MLLALKASSKLQQTAISNVVAALRNQIKLILHGNHLQANGLHVTSGTGLPSAVGNVSGNRCESDCRSRGPEFNPGPVPYFCGDSHEIISTIILLPSTESFKKGCCQLQAKVCARSTD